MIYEFTPTQDYNGYAEPWPAGSGKNIFPPDADIEKPSWYTGTWEGTTLEADGIRQTRSFAEGGAGGFVIGPLAAGTYTFSATVDGSATSYRFNWAYTADGTTGVSGGLSTPSMSGARASVSFTLTEDALEVAIRPMPFDYNAGYTSTLFSKIQIESGSTATTWSPYENLCPIIGYNIWNPYNEEMMQVYSGYVDAEARKLYLHPWYPEYDGEELVGPWMSSLDKYTEDGTPTIGAFVVDMGGELIEADITDFMLQTLLDSLGIRRFITSGAMLLNSLMDQAQGRVRSEEELLNLSLPIHVIAIGDELPTNLIIKKSDVLPGLPGKIKI